MTNIDKNYTYLGRLFLKLIKESRDFKTDLEAAAPEIYADIQSFTSNPNCSCKNKIMGYVNANKEKSADFANQAIAKYDLKVDLEALETEVKNDMINSQGAFVRRIKKSEWINFPSQMMQERIFVRSFSVVPVNEEEIDVYVLR